MTTQEKCELVREYQRQTTGTDGYYRHPFGVKFTDGVKYVADTCGAYWLLDIIGSYWLCNPSIRAIPFQVWRLEAPTEGRQGWRVSCWSDVPGESTHLAHQEFEYSDFPTGLLPFDLWVESGVIILPEEH